MLEIKGIKYHHIKILAISIVGLSLSLDAFAIFWNVYTSKAHRNLAPVTVSTTTIKKTVPSFFMVTSSIQGPDDSFSIDAQFPVFSNFADAQTDSEVNGQLQVFVHNLMLAYQTDFGSNEYKQPGMPSYAALGAEVTLLNNSWVSVHMPYGANYSGAAHPNSGSKTFNYYIAEHRIVPIGDLFKTDSNYASKLKQIVIADIVRQRKAVGAADETNDTQTFMDVWEGRTDLFNNFSLAPNELRIYFDQCEAGACVEGPREVHVPMQKIRDILAAPW